MIVGHGLAKHHFWGDYKTTIVVAFPPSRHLTAEAVSEALPSFNVAPEGEEGKVVARFFGGDTELDTAIDELVAAGAERSKVLSLARSIDWGEQFTVSIAPVPQEVQAPLFPQEAQL